MPVSNDKFIDSELYKHLNDIEQVAEIPNGYCGQCGEVILEPTIKEIMQGKTKEHKCNEADSYFNKFKLKYGIKESEDV